MLSKFMIVIYNLVDFSLSSPYGLIPVHYSCPVDNSFSRIFHHLPPFLLRCPESFAVGFLAHSCFLYYKTSVGCFCGLPPLEIVNCSFPFFRLFFHTPCLERWFVPPDVEERTQPPLLVRYLFFEFFVSPTAALLRFSQAVLFFHGTFISEEDYDGFFWTDFFF